MTTARWPSNDERVTLAYLVILVDLSLSGSNNQSPYLVLSVAVGLKGATVMYALCRFFVTR